MVVTRCLLYGLQLQVRWGDMDAVGHVNNAMYFRYLEQARVSWFESIGLYVSGEGEGPVIVNAACTFLKSIVYPATIDVEMFGEAPGRSSFGSYYEIRDAANSDILYSTGDAKIVWVDHSKGHSTELPESIRKLLPQTAA